jgi:hypothetical protein
VTPRPPKQWCRECGKELGRGWARAPLCADCAPNHTICSCEIQNFDPACPIHLGRDPYDIPY